MNEYFSGAANTNANPKTGSLSSFEETLFKKFTEFHSKGYVAFLVVLIADKNDNGLMTYTDPITKKSVSCSYDFTPIPEGANPYVGISNYTKANFPVILAMDLISKGSDPRKQMPEGWTPGSIVFPSDLQGNPVISLAPPKTYTTRADENPDLTGNDGCKGGASSKPVLHLVINNP